MPHERRLREEYGKQIAEQIDREVRSKLRTFREAMSMSMRDPAEIEVLARKLEVRLRQGASHEAC